MPLPTSSALPLVAADDVLARRYRLVRPLPRPADAVSDVWLATDDVLARPVAVTVLAARAQSATAFLQAAARAGAVEARPVTRVYDAAVEPRSRRPSVVYVVSEWVEGRALPAVLAAGPLGADEALALARQACAAVADVHRTGAVHGRLHPGNVLVTATGRLRLTDTETAAVLHDRAATPEDDVRDLAALLYAMLTGCWPGSATPQPGRGLPPAPRVDRDPRAAPCSPRQVRAGVPRALDDVVRAALLPSAADGPQVATAADLLRALEEVGGAEPPTAAPPPAPVPPARRPWRRVLAVSGLAVLLGLLGLGSYLLAGQDEAPSPPAPTAAASPPPVTAPPRPLDLAATAVRDYDPLGRPQEERPDLVPRARDGLPATAWTTESYRSAAFGGLKSGVGLLVDLGAPIALSEVDVDLTAPGTAVELRAGNALGADQEALPVVVRDDGTAGQVRLRVPPGAAAARYWLVWLTRLPPADGQFRAGIAELRLLPSVPSA